MSRPPARSPSPDTIHATCIAWRGNGVLLRGPSGSGKSDLALRLIDAGSLLVGDDRVVLSVRGPDLIARAAAELAGLLEVRGLGILTVPYAAEAVVKLVVDLTTHDAIERLPEPARCDFLGVRLPCVALAPFEASAAAKVRIALTAARAQGFGPGAAP